jgi:hypothetical protein
MSAGSSMKITSLPAKSGFCKNLTEKKSQQLFSIFSIVRTLNGLIWWNKKKFEYFHLTWDSRFLQADALKRAKKYFRSSTKRVCWCQGRTQCRQKKKMLLGRRGLNQGCSLMAWSPEKSCVFEASEERFPCFQRGILIKVVGFCICS